MVLIAFSAEFAKHMRPVTSMSKAASAPMWTPFPVKQFRPNTADAGGPVKNIEEADSHANDESETSSEIAPATSMQEPSAVPEFLANVQRVTASATSR
jgi:hypothetical protein